MEGFTVPLRNFFLTRLLIWRFEFFFRKLWDTRDAALQLVRKIPGIASGDCIYTLLRSSFL